MVTRVSTAGNYASVLANLMVAQQRQIEAGNQVATQKKGSNLKDYAKSAELLTAMRSVQARQQVYQDQNGMVADKLTTQDSALNQVTNAATAVRQAITDALASGHGDTLMQDLQAQMTNAVEGMNARYNGKYLFAGGQIDTKPVTAVQMSDLTVAPATISSFFQNDSFKAQAKVDDSTTVTTGVLASDVGTPLMTALQTIQSFQEGPSGPFTGKLTAAQTTFLQSQLAGLDTVRTDLIGMTAGNGLVQQRVASVKENLTTRDNTLAGMVGDITDADMAQAASQLQLAQLSVQAAAQVYQTLQQSSLLNLLK
jgi:flagellar hook-associated protein 3 FlgL